MVRPFCTLRKVVRLGVEKIQRSVTTGVRPSDNGVSLDLDVTRHIRLQAGVDASGGSSAGVGAEWE
jgi:translocation and assembly module TamB